jgi:hypothetical protein
MMIFLLIVIVALMLTSAHLLDTNKFIKKNLNFQKDEVKKLWKEIIQNEAKIFELESANKTKDEHIEILKEKIYKLNSKFTIRVSIFSGYCVLAVDSCNGSEVLINSHVYTYKSQAMNVARSLSKASGWKIKVVDNA